MKKIISVLLIVRLVQSVSIAQPNWAAIKANSTFIVPDTNYLAPVIQPVNVPGWEDGLFMTRDGKHLFSTYLPLDAFSWIGDLVLNPVCFNFNPYFRPPLLGIDTATNIWGCPNFMQSDIIISSRTDISLPFNAWSSSNLQTSFSFDGGAQGVLLNSDSFDVFIYTKDGIGTQNEDIMFMKNVPVNPDTATAIPILSTTAQEDNPHVERLNDSTLVLFFDRDRYIYYAFSYDNGDNWQAPVLITKVLNDQAPYDVQPHLWNDGVDWWVYFCADNIDGKRCIYKARQLIANDWNSWGARQLVIEPGNITGGYGAIYGVGEPTLSQWGDLSFVVVYGDINSADTTDVFDCDPWILLRKSSPLITTFQNLSLQNRMEIFPNPVTDFLQINLDNGLNKKTTIKITNAMGVVVKETELTRSSRISVADLPGGIYFISQKNNLQLPVKFIKR